MEYIEWSKYEKHNDAKSDLILGYVLDKDSRFIMEPAFYTQLTTFKSFHPELYDTVINAINKNVKKNKKVFFTVDIEHPFIDLKDYIYLEITDILDPLHIFVEDKSRGSDYGD